MMLSIGDRYGDFYLLGINIGADERDYKLLLGEGFSHPQGTIKSLMDEYRQARASVGMKEKDEDRGEGKEEEESEINHSYRCWENNRQTEERIFSFLLDDNGEIDPQDADLADLIFQKGLDILENALASKGKTLTKKQFNELIANHSSKLLNLLSKRINDDEGAWKLRQQYPKLCLYLFHTYTNEIPVQLRDLYTSNSDILEKNTQPPASKPPVNLLDAQLKSIKDRLAAQFFKKVISSSKRPAVITLQEVYSNVAILEILKKRGYGIAHQENWNAAIAIDNTRFKECTAIPVNEQKIAIVHAIEKRTQEEFLFFSIHGHGYQLEFPKETEDDEEKMAAHLKKVEDNIEYGLHDLIAITLRREMASMKEKYPKATLIVQGDFNTYPEYFELPRVSAKIKAMSIFAKFDAYGLDCVRTNRPTELNLYAKSLQNRELDYVFISKTAAARIRPIDPKDQELTLAKVTEEKLIFDPMLLFSDHRPIWMKMTGKK